MSEMVDVTQKATTMGWVLPDKWEVRAYTVRDEDVTDPRKWGDVYKTDVDEADYDHPTHAFCSHCNDWIIQSDGVWNGVHSGSVCCGQDGAHHPNTPLTVRMFQTGQWGFVTVVVEVYDSWGHRWSRATLSNVEKGTYPHRINEVTGQVFRRDVNPLQEEYPMSELVPEAVTQAQERLRSVQGLVIASRR